MAKNYTALTLIIIAGELIFSLPFHVTRYFKPTFLESFAINNTVLGDAFAFYGLLALISYFPGGYLADKYSAKKLMALALFLTGAGGFFFASFPDPGRLRFLYGFWGITTILFFWGALIKYTSLWGGNESQGKAFGYLEAGRGLVASVSSSFALLIFYFSTDLENGVQSSTKAIQNIIFYYSCLTIFIGLLILVFLRENQFKKTKIISSQNKEKLQIYPVGLISIIIICAYCGFRSIDNAALYLTEVGQLSELEASTFITILGYLRIVAAFAAGFIADKITSAKLVTILFIVSMLTQSVLCGFFLQEFYQLILICSNFVIMFLAIVSLRAVYFSLIEPVGINSNRLGVCIGIISLVGFTPDIFFHSLTGRILDANPGLVGHQNFYLATMILSAIGLLTSLRLSNWIVKKKRYNFKNH